MISVHIHLSLAQAGLLVRVWQSLAVLMLVIKPVYLDLAFRRTIVVLHTYKTFTSFLKDCEQNVDVPC